MKFRTESESDGKTRIFQFNRQSQVKLFIIELLTFN